MEKLTLEQRLILWRLRNGGRLVLIWKDGTTKSAAIELSGGKLSNLCGKKNIHAAYLLWANNWVEKKGPKCGEVTEKFTVSPKGSRRIKEWKLGEETMKEIRSKERKKRKDRS